MPPTAAGTLSGHGSQIKLRRFWLIELRVNCSQLTCGGERRKEKNRVNFGASIAVRNGWIHDN